jgi:murein DD-endopeptidase MepM/ murein hydrolase activator NlpD
MRYPRLSLLAAVFSLLLLAPQVAKTQTSEDFQGEGTVPTIRTAPFLPPSEPMSPARGWQQGSFPVENFQAYTSPFGYRSSATGGGGTEFHSGLDFAAPLGSYVRNWWAGRVIEVSDHTACGTMIRVQSGAWVHVYCHLQGRVEQDGSGRFMLDRTAGIEVREGQMITAGMRIGRIGMTGRTTGPHLHWTVKYQGELVDPALVLRAMQARRSNNPLLSISP